jgi:hypothetical protein
MSRKGEPICLKIAAYLSQSAVANGDGPSTQLEILDIIAGDNNVPTENAITANIKILVVQGSDVIQFTTIQGQL